VDAQGLTQEVNAPGFFNGGLQEGQLHRAAGLVSRGLTAHFLRLLALVTSSSACSRVA